MLKQDEGAKGAQASIGRALAVIPLSPNQWTVLSVLIAIGAGISIAATQDLFLGLALFALAGLCDIIDGAVARARGEASALGGFIDGVADRFVEGIFLLSLMFVPLPQVLVEAKIWLALTIFLGTCMPSFVRAYADHKGVISREKALALGGVCERSERLLILILGLGAGLALGMEYLIYALAAVCFLSAVTIIQRILGVLAAQPNVKA
ncbi:CDP-alcohol phosphatidyltransferase family protein [Candidatus Micrarchaeota archaeon]|nr:CDP-alcohol phosphatidyltransferase family protein [Candidatus Micrarchaeota archaeon]